MDREYWVIIRTFDGSFKPKKLTKEESKRAITKVFNSEDETWEAIRQIHIEPEH